jgi:hypothetical protein
MTKHTDAPELTTDTADALDRKIDALRKINRALKPLSPSERKWVLAHFAEDVDE